MPSDYSEEINHLGTNATDITTSILKSTVGVIPLFGPAAQELLGVIIPNQRLDRVVAFVTRLSDSFDELKDNFNQFNEKIRGPVYSSIFYKACAQAADATTDERIDYIKNLFSRCLKSEEIEAEHYEALLSLIGRMSDMELRWLKFYQLLTYGHVEEAKSFRHNVLAGGFLKPNVHGGMSNAERDAETMKAIYSSNLVSLGLLTMEYDAKGNAKYKCSPLGRLLIETVTS